MRNDIITGDATGGRAPGRAVALTVLSLVFLIIPNFNIIDIFPDFVAYIILARFFSRYVEYAPYFTEAKEAFIKLAVITAAKLPAMIIMIANMGEGRDIVPLFTLAFGALEILFLFPAVTNAFSALTYLGERGSLTAAIKPIPYLGRAVSVDDARGLTYVFISVKALFNLIPDMFLLTPVAETEEEAIQALKMQALFPIATVISMAVILWLGIFFALLVGKYAIRIARDGGVLDAARSVAGAARLAELDGERSVKAVLRTLTLVMLSAILSFDITFDGLNGGVNILPHFFLAFFMIWCISRISAEKRVRYTALVVGLFASAASIYEHLLLIAFTDRFYYTDLGHIADADSAYLSVEIFALIELLLFAMLTVIFASQLTGYILRHTTLSLSDGEMSQTDREFKRKMSVKAYILGYAPLLILALKCAEVFIRGDVRYILSPAPDNAQSAPIITSSMPWFGFLILGVTIAFAFYSYYFINEAKDEVRMKYSNEKQSFE